ncbi:hypothetical protein Fuma_03406 [Fuerstiella marisgermanici]|uniref:Uncharacterized protein n=1 Tax=Fuerstiella marisgermanici TaxID=1891926 RepID=A0A1P8WIA7_9PLAN|nr:hypothetical protein Fuma_03406 [Fuerstiella marisgermanici]
MTVDCRKLCFARQLYPTGHFSLNHDDSAANLHSTTVLKRSTPRETDKTCPTI